MTEAEYVESVLGVPWVFAGCDYDGMDCGGLVRHSCMVLDNINLPPFEPCNDVHAAFTNAPWLTPCEWKNRAVFTVSDDKGNMYHVGRILAGMAVHAHGKKESAGQVRAQTKAQLSRVFGAENIHTFEVTL